MPPDVHRLLEREAERVNSTILMNRRAYADLISNLLSGKLGERAGRMQLSQIAPLIITVLVITKHYGVQAITIKVQNAFALTFDVLCVSFTLQMVKTCVIKLQGTEGPNARDQIAFNAFHSFFNSGSPNKCWLHTCEACVIRTWRLGCRLLLSPAMKRLFCLLKVPLLVKTN